MNSEHPIIFSAPMVRAILAGAKTQTRRLEAKPGRLELFRRLGPMQSDGDLRAPMSRYGTIGDQLWVRETWQYDPAGKLPLIYRASDPQGYSEMPNHLWRSPIFMPRWACRIVLEVTGIRAERLQDITCAGVLAEGLLLEFIAGIDIDIDGQLWPAGERKLLAAWAAGWDELNGKRGAWASNPWVWVVTFRRVNP